MSARLNEIIKLFLKYYCQSSDVLIDLKACSTQCSILAAIGQL